jgi:hypothetical protein
MQLLSKILGDADHLPELYKTSWHNNPKESAQKNLEGRTHYVEPSTLRYFNSRIVSALPVTNGAFFKIIESLSLDHNNTKRGFRAVLFDIFGTVVYRPSLEECFTSKEKADKNFYAWFEEFNEFEHYRNAIMWKLQKVEKEQMQLAEVFQTLNQIPYTLTEEELTA